MGKFNLANISSAGNVNLSDGTFIILFNVTAIPPHLLLSVNGKIYSITDSGRQMGSSLEKLIGFVKRKNVPTVFVEWILLESWNVERMESEARKCFLKYDRVVEGKISCLFPIRDVAAAVLGNEMNEAGFIFELLPLMDKANAIGKTFALNLPNEMIVNGDFELPTYDNDQLRRSLQSAQFPKTENHSS